jgi:hypothetical protein
MPESSQAPANPLHDLLQIPTRAILTPDLGRSHPRKEEKRRVGIRAADDAQVSSYDSHFLLKML